MLRSNFCDYIHAYILVKGNISVNNIATARAAANNIGKKSKSCVPFTNCVAKIDNAQTDNTEYIDTVMPIYNLLEYSDKVIIIHVVKCSCSYFINSR